MKLIFLSSSFSIVWYMRRHRIVRKSYDKEQDTFRHYLLVLPCLVLALFIHHKFTFFEVRFFCLFGCLLHLDSGVCCHHLPSLDLACQVLWTFSLYLEAVAILPQLVLLQRTKNVDNLTGNYVFLLGLGTSTI